MALEMIKLTSPSNQPVWLVVSWIIKVAPALIDEYGGEANAVVTLSGGAQAVRETPEDVVKMLANRAGVHV